MADESELPVALNLLGPREPVAALQGRFALGDDPTAGVLEFVERHREALGLGKTELADDAIVQRDGDTLCLTFPLRVDDVPVFRSGVGVHVDSGVLTSLSTRIPNRLPARAPKSKLSEAVAERVAGKRLGIEDGLGDGSLELVDRPSLFGEPGRMPAWVFRAEAGGQAFEIVVGGSSRAPAVDVIGMPADDSHCPIDPVPRYHLRFETETPDFVTFAPNGLLLPEATSGRPDAVAVALFERHPKLYGTGDVRAQLRVERVEQDLWTGLTHVVLQQVYGGLPVYGCKLRVHLDSASLAIRSVSGVYVRELDPEVGPTSLTAAEALQRVVAAEIARGFPEAELKDFMHARPDLVGPEAVVLPGLLSTVPLRNLYCWKVGTPEFDRFVIGQAEGQGSIVFSAPQVDNARIVFEWPTEVLRDGQAAPGTVPTQASQDLDTRIARVASLFTLFGRSSYDDRGGDLVGIRSPTAVSGVASWSRTNLNVMFSPGSDVGDITGHEFVHGLTQMTAELIYLDEPGALNEHYSDVLGSLVFPDAPAGTWLVGEDFGTVRDMANPATFGQVGNFGSYVPRATCCANSTDIATLPASCIPACDNGGVHTNSGIGNFAAVQICDGDIAHTGTGRPVLLSLFWEVLTRRLGPWSTYTDELHNTWEAARDLTGLGRVARAMPWSPDPSAPFTAAVVAQTLWGFQQAGLDLSLTSGWFQVKGEANTTKDETHYAGVLTEPGWRVLDHQVMVRTPADKATWSSVIRASGPQTTTDPSGSTMVTFLSGHVGTRDASFSVRYTNTRFQEIGRQPSTIPEPDPAAPPPAGPVMVRDFLPDAGITNWFDNPFFAGRKYDDTLRAGQDIVGPGTVTDVFLDVFDNHGVIVGTHRLGDPQVVWGGTGAEITARTLGGTALEVSVHSWHNFGWAVRYRITYVVDHDSTTSVSLPSAPVRPPKHK
jgi:hypothetical protein